MHETYKILQGFEIERSQTISFKEIVHNLVLDATRFFKNVRKFCLECEILILNISRQEDVLMRNSFHSVEVILRFIELVI